MLDRKLTVVLATCLLSGAAFAAERGHDTHTHWSYEGAGGPQHWAELEEGYRACGDGKNQSPVNLTRFVKGELPPIEFHYQASGDQVVNNGHTIQVNFPPGSSITVAGHTFALKQFHAHAPSEHLINGKSFPLEAHFVHADDAGNLAVVAVMFEEGAANPELEKAWRAMPQHVGEKAVLKDKVLGTAIMPADKHYYRYNGSLTTPPCTEGVTWLVLKQPVTASREQIERFARILHYPNNRPVQPLNARFVLE